MSAERSRRRPARWPFWAAALLVSIGAQFIIISVVAPQGFLATLISASFASPYAANPYNFDLHVSLTSSSGMLYAGTVPHSFALRARDGSVALKTPDRLFAVYQGILLASSEPPGGGPTLIEAFSASDGALLWSFQVGSLEDAQVSDGTLYISEVKGGSQAIIDALAPTTGHLLWRYRCAPAECDLFSPLKIANGGVYAVETKGSYSVLLALRASTGALLWRGSTALVGSTFFIAGNAVIAQSEAAVLAAFDAESGRLLWQSGPLLEANLPWRGIAATGQVAFIQASGSVFALRLESGALLWQWQGSIVEAQLSESRVYVATTSDLVAVDASSGQEQWRQAYPLANGVTILGESNGLRDILGEFNGMVYLHLPGQGMIPRTTATGDMLAAFRSADGGLVWQRSVGPVTDAGAYNARGQGILALTPVAAALVDGVIYVAEYQYISTAPYFHLVYSVAPAARAFFNSTTFILTAQAIDGQTGSVFWRVQQTEQYRVF